MTNELSYPSRIVALLGCDILLAVLNSYVPHELGPIRMILAGIQLVFMAATMAIALMWVLEDY